MTELKIRLTDYQAIEEKLRGLGATFKEKTSFADTYFNQPAGEVFKVSEVDKGFFLVQLQKTPEGKFQVLKDNQIEHADQVIAEMTNEYGVKCILKGQRRVYILGDLKVTINLIADKGAFLILTGENPTEDFIITKLGLQNPEYITVSFDDVAQSPFTLPTE
jgi:adenylate cyclase class IV